MADAISYPHQDDTGAHSTRVKVTMDLDMEEWHNIRRVVQQLRNKEGQPDLSLDQAVYFIVMEHGAEIGMAQVLDNDPVANRPNPFADQDKRSKKASRLFVGNPTPGRNGEQRFRVTNPASQRSYTVTRKEDTWNCPCADFRYRQVICKHIAASKQKLAETV